MIYGQIQLAGLPVNLILLLEAGEVVFVRTLNAGSVLDNTSAKGVVALFCPNEFYVNGNAYRYNIPYAYKELPDMLAWLEAQQLQLEDINIFEEIQCQ